MSFAHTTSASPFPPTRNFADFVFYWFAVLIARVITGMTIRFRRHHIATGARHGGYLLACAHVSHLDPFLLSAIWPRKIGWMARVEFYRKTWSAFFMRSLHAFPVHRQGVPVSAIREALARLARGEVVGVFPEGEITTGADSVLRGGTIKRGVCLLAARSGRPVLPCIIVGTEKLLAVGPWLPAKRGRLWMICGDFIEPEVASWHRAGRARMAAQIEREFVRLFAELRERWHLDDSIVP